MSEYEDLITLSVNGISFQIWTVPRVEFGKSKSVLLKPYNFCFWRYCKYLTFTYHTIGMIYEQKGLIQMNQKKKNGIFPLQYISERGLFSPFGKSLLKRRKLSQ